MSKAALSLSPELQSANAMPSLGHMQSSRS